MSDISGDWPAYVDDSGSLTDGTVVNAALLNLVKAAINLQVYSVTNPTITPAAIIDETVLARGSMANLNARLSVSLGADGSLIAASVVGYLNGTVDLGTDWQVYNSRAFTMEKVGLAHGMTTIIATDIYGRMNALDVTNGGVNINGFSKNDNIALNISGCVGSTTPVNPAVTIRAFKKSGTTLQALAATETALAFQNSTVTYAQFYGSGKLGWFDNAVAHGMTDIESTNSWGQILINSATAGGIRVRGLTDTADTPAANITGIIQAGSATAAAVVVDTYKKSGTSAIALTSGDLIFSAGTNGVAAFTVAVGGTTAIGNLAAQSYGAVGFLSVGRANGTSSAPTTILSGDSLGTMYFGGYNSADGGMASGPQITATASEDWNVTLHRGAHLSLSTWPSGGAGWNQRIFLSDKGNVVLGGANSGSTTAALATNATDGFVHIPSCAGAPSGVPTAYTGMKAMVYDTTNNKLWVYNGAWKFVAFT